MSGQQIEQGAAAAPTDTGGRRLVSTSARGERQALPWRRGGGHMSGKLIEQSDAAVPTDTGGKGRLG